MISDNPIFLSFSSPKGGVGRTMVAANVAAIYASGCEWAGLEKTAVLAVDTDVRAPGLHFYDFLSHLKTVEGDTANGEGWNYWFGGKPISSIGELHSEIRKQSTTGILYWVAALMNSEFKEAIMNAKNRGVTENEADKIAYEKTIQLIERNLDSPNNLLDPLHHLVQIKDPTGATRLLLLPAADPQQTGYRKAVLDFSWNAFFSQFSGLAVLDALQCFICKNLPSANKGFPRIRRVLLDQDAGETWPSAANRVLATDHIFVAGLNQQNRSGLHGLLNGHGSTERLRFVLSKYRGRSNVLNVQDGTGDDLLDGFAENDDIRAAITNDLKTHYNIPNENVFLADFLPEAIGAEYFAPPRSLFYDELVRLIVSIENSHKPPAKNPELMRSQVKEIRLLGEYVGVASQISGPLGAFREWLQTELGEQISITGIATGHDEIVELVTKGAIEFSAAETNAARPEGFQWGKSQLTHLDKAQSSGKKSSVRLGLTDFDIVALPVYVAATAGPNLEILSLPTETLPSSKDRIGQIDLAYLKERIWGWKHYADTPDGNGGHLRGYPLFTDCQLLAYNRKRINEKEFGPHYFRTSLRHFNGFREPGDFFEAARAAHISHQENDNLLMNVKPNNIAKWYEWQLVLQLQEVDEFGDQGTRKPFDELSANELRRLISDEVIQATVRYCELVCYAVTKSYKSDWEEALQHFFKESDVGIAFIWPDAIPEKYRTTLHSVDTGSNRDQVFYYSIPPSSFQREECWLLSIPAKRKGLNRPDVRDLESVLQRFMTVESQRLYHAKGGLPTNRSVLFEPDLWRTNMALASVAKLSTMETERRRRICSPQAREIAVQIAQALDGILDWLKEKRKDLSPEEKKVLPFPPKACKELKTRIKKAFTAIVDRKSTSRKHAGRKNV